MDNNKMNEKDKSVFNLQKEYLLPSVFNLQKSTRRGIVAGLLEGVGFDPIAG